MKSKVGRKVRCNVDGSWVHLKAGVVIKEDVLSSDGIGGLLLQMDGCRTVVPEGNCVFIDDPTSDDFEIDGGKARGEGHSY